MSTEEMREQRARKGLITGTQNSESIWRFPELNNLLTLADEGDIRSARTPVMRPVNSESLSRLEDQDEQLFPGLSNEIVLNQIVPKLPWRTFHILSSVNRSWLQAIRSHQVFDARVRSHSTETLLVLNFTHSINSTLRGVHAICIYSVEGKTWHRLPDFPHKRIVRGIPNKSGCVSLDGKVYILGGESEEDTFQTDSKEVYVLDLAGQTGWRQCADMLEPRQNFAYGVMDGKIYVVGGTSCGKTIRRSEVYDPKENAWSSISPMILTRAEHQFVTVGEELWLYGGSFYDRDCEFFRENNAEDDPSSNWTCSWGLHRGLARNEALFPEIYRPSTGEWELVKPFELWHLEILFAVQGKLCRMSPDGISVHDCAVHDCGDGEYWTGLYSFSGVESPDSIYIGPFAVYPVNDELFALVHWATHESWPKRTPIALLHSEGFGKENDQIVWKKLKPVCLNEVVIHLGPPSGQPFMCPVQL